MSDDLRAELLKKAKKAKIDVGDDWTVDDLETALAVKALETEKPAPKGPAPGNVMVRITKAGSGLVADGKGGAYLMDDVVELPLEVAQALELRHYAEIR
jgi:hypothetical protein